MQPSDRKVVRSEREAREQNERDGLVRQTALGRQVTPKGLAEVLAAMGGVP